MKRIVAVFMTFLSVMLLFVSCADNASSERRDKDEQTTTTLPPSDSQPDIEYVDKTDYTSLRKNDDPSVLLYAGEELVSPTFCAYYHNYKSALSLTFDDGYDINSIKYVSSVFSKYNIHGTAMISPCFLKHNDGTDNEYIINAWRDVLSQGYIDVGVHGYDHIDPRNVTTEELLKKEIVDSKQYLKTLFPNQNILTFATPFANITNQYEAYLSQHYIANREDAGVTPNLLDNFNQYRIASVAVRNDMSATDIYNASYRYLEQGKWCVILMHCVEDGKATTSTNTTRSVFSEYVSTMYNKYRNTWFASFEEVAIYKEQLNNAKINYKSADKEKMVFNVTCDLDNDIYNIPMSIKINIPYFSNTAYVKIGDVDMDCEVVSERDKKYVYILDCPVNGEDIEIYLAGNRTCDNGCRHYYDIVERVPNSCSQRGYAVHSCKRCGNTYYNDFVAKMPHKFGEWVGSNDATYKERKCSVCDKTEKVDIKYENIAPTSIVTATPSVNEYAPISAINDGSASSRYQSSQGTGTSIEIELINSKRYISALQLVVSNYQKIDWIIDGEQEIEISVYKDGVWEKVGTWNNNDDTYADNTITLSFNILDNVSKIKIDFVKGVLGAVDVYEAYVMAEIE